MGSRTSILTVVVVLALALQPVTVASATPTAVSTPETSNAFAPNSIADEADNGTAAMATAPPDPEEDVLGWENGYWYNETVDVTRDNGLNESELDAVVARCMARVEQIRGLEFEETPPVEVISRKEHAAEMKRQYKRFSKGRQLLYDVKYEALFMVDESTDGTDEYAALQAGGIGAYYSSSSEDIAIISENTSTPKMDEIALAQELYHALQDQQFNISALEFRPRERHNANDGLIEGDGNYVDRLYRQRCADEWEGSCLLPGAEESSNNIDVHPALQQIFAQPYIDGPPWVKEVRDAGGWEAVNELYEQPPASTEQTIHPEKYGTDEPTDITVADRSADEWRPLAVEDGIDYASFGEAGLYVALWYPAQQTQGAVSIISLADHLNQLPDGTLDPTNPLNYSHRYTAGWDGDKLIPYVTDDSFKTNETGYVYKTVWDSPDEAAEFREGYEQLLEFNGAEPVDDHADTYRIPDDEGFGDAFYLNLTDDTFTIVNAPSVDELSAVREGAAPEAVEETTEADDATQTESDGTTEADSSTATDEDGTATTDTESTPAGETDTPSTDTTSTSGPGFTVVSVLVAIVALGSVVLRRS